MLCKLKYVPLKVVDHIAVWFIGGMTDGPGQMDCSKPMISLVSTTSLSVIYNFLVCNLQLPCLRSTTSLSVLQKSCLYLKKTQVFIKILYLYLEKQTLFTNLFTEIIHKHIYIALFFYIFTRNIKKYYMANNYHVRLIIFKRMSS